jgi:hypothetical protein
VVAFNYIFYMEERGNQIQNPLSISLFCVIYIYIYKMFPCKVFFNGEGESGGEGIWWLW